MTEATEGAEGGTTTFTQEQLDEAVKDALAQAKAGNDEAFGNLWKEAKQAKAKLAAYDGVDAEEYKKLKAAAEKAERERAEAEGDFKSIEAQLKERHAQELAAKDKVLAKYRSAVDKRVKQAELIKAIVAAGGDPALLLPHAEKFVDVRETDNDFEAFIIDEQGQPLVADGQGTPMTLEMVIQEKLVPQFPRAFGGTGSSGGGASRSDAGGGGAGPRKVSASDPDAWFANLDGIVSGKVGVSE